MLKKNITHILLIVIGFCSVTHHRLFAQEAPVPSQEVRFDSTGNLVFPFEDEGEFDYPDQVEQNPLYLQSPSNIERKVEYDPNTRQYIIYEKVGNTYYRMPKTMSLQEYVKYDFDQSVRDYWRTRREVERVEAQQSGSLIPQLKIDSEAFTNIFGSNTIDIRPQGYVEVSIGYRSSFIDDKSRPERLRRIPSIDFDQQINMSVTGKIGDKVDMRVNFNTEATFDYENKMNINYTGKEDEILRKIEAGNVSLPLNGTLIQGGTNLFGFKTEMQFGKLNLTTVVSQHKGESQTIETEGGAQKTRFDLRASDYDENRHFFLSKYFRDNYDAAMARSPVVISNIDINRVEVWVTNKTQDFSGSRDVVAFVDLGEHEAHIFNTIPGFGPNYGESYTRGRVPDKDANKLYEAMISGLYSGIRTSSDVMRVLSPLEIENFKNGQDWEKVDQARRLSSSEFTINPKLGYISLRSPLNADEVLAVAYNYSIGDTVFQVGEFANDVDAPSTLILKLIKGTNLAPGLPTWDLMMKNIYSLGAYDLSADDFEFNIVIKNDSTNSYINYMPEGRLADMTLLRVMNLDNVNSQNDYTENGDGMFDFAPGYTVQRENGRVIFPVVEPFGSHLRKMLNDAALADKYVYQSLYDSIKTLAQQDKEKDKFYMMGSYKGSSGSEIMLNAFNLAPGSVVVSSGGRNLDENVHYTVDYSLGRVKIIDAGLLEAGTPIQVSIESQEIFSMQRKTMLGSYASYEVSNKLNIGGTMLYMNERPITNKVNFGEESISNLMLGLDFQYRDQSQLLTDLVNYLPFTDTNVKSSFSIEGEVAKLFPGQSKFTGDVVYIDDYVAVETSISLNNFLGWHLASTPQGQPSRFPEASLFNDLGYGYNRAKMAWYYVDPLFSRPSNLTPAHMKSDLDMLSNHYTRAVDIREIYPGKELPPATPSIMYPLNLSYYPTERGPYNYDLNVNPDGSLRDPMSRWGGIMRDIQTPNFEAANVEYIEFWMLDPFIYDEGTHRGGDLFINLGSISEDILRDGRKSFENGLPTSELLTNVDTTAWGLVPTTQLLNHAFANSLESRLFQDVGLDGLSDVNERTFFVDLIEKMREILTPEAFNKFEADPSSDNYQYFRGSHHDEAERSVIDRYKNINGPDMNSPFQALSTESFQTSMNELPNIEDINKDNTLNELEAYYQYRISIRPEDLVVGSNFVVDKITRRVELPNKIQEDVDWYLVKIPIRSFEEKVGNISGFNSIRFMRMFMTNFSDSVILRMATLSLVRSDWRKVTHTLAEPGVVESPNTDFVLSSINIEENAFRTPINYVLPPDIEREDDVASTTLVKMNEQSMLLKVTELEPGDARAVYKNIGLDIRQYKRLIMDVHAEAIQGYALADNEVSLFVQMGTDRMNYYEYEIPLKLTPVPATRYNGEENSPDRLIVWPKENKLDVDLEIFPALKIRRDALVRRAGSTLSQTDIYQEPDEKSITGKNLIKIIGNPSLADVDMVTIGIRNPSSNGSQPKSVEVWVNELRLSDFDKKGGWASAGRMSLRLADLGSITLAGGTQSVGWGSINQSVSQRSLEDRYQYDLAANVQLGKLLPKKLGLQMPMFYSISQRVATPEYDPLKSDVKLTDMLEMTDSPEEREAIKNRSQDVTTRRSLNFNNISIEPERKNTQRKPMPYDIENFTVSYAENEQLSHNIDVEKYLQRSKKGVFNYNYSANPYHIEPFKNIKFLNNQMLRLIKDFNFNLVPTMFSFRTDLTRNYSERLARNNTDIGLNMPLNVQKDLLWNRYFDFRFNLARSLSIDFSNQNIARIDELEGPMDPIYDNYSEMQQEIYTNLRNLGRPVDYRHTINIRYTPPISKLPLMEWMSGDITYQGRYDWKAGPKMGVNDTLMLGNTANNGMTMNFGANANFLSLYNKVPYLRDVNNKYQSSARNVGARRQQQQQQQQQQQRQPQQQGADVRTKTVNFTERKVAFKADVPKSVFHKLGTQKVEVLVISAQGDTIQGETVVVNENRVNFTVPASINNATVLVTGEKVVGDSFLKKSVDLSARMLMSVRSIRASYNQTGSTLVPGFMPQPYLFGGSNHTPSAEMFGNMPSMMAPTLPFLMGWQDESFGLDAANRGWITKSQALNERYLYRIKETYNFSVQAEPLPNLRIDLTGTRSEAQNISSRLNYNAASGNFEAVNRKEEGNFDMSIFTLKTAFRKSEKLTGSDTQVSELFNQFVGPNREVVMRRLNESRGFVEGQGYVNYRDYDTNYETAGYSATSAEVLIPAFIAAYTGTDPEKVALSPFPGLQWMRPNWRVSYTGNPSAVSWMKDYIYSINISHNYRATYAVGQFETNLSHNANNQSGFSWVRSQLDNYFIPQYDINSVTIQESFQPLINVDIGFVNDLSIRFDLKKQRNLNLSFTNNQLTEMIKDEFTLGVGYRFTGMDMIIKTRRKDQSVSNDVNLRFDMSSGNYKSTYRKIVEDVPQLFGGMKTLTLDFTADYMLSDRFTMKLYFKYNMNKPHLANAYETRNTNFGLTFNFSIM